MFNETLYKNKASPDDVQRNKRNSIYIIAELRPFVIITINRVRSITLKLAKIFSCNLAQIQTTNRLCAEKKKRTVTPQTVLEELRPFEILLLKSCPLYNFNTVKRHFHEFATNIKYQQTMCREKNINLWKPYAL